MPAIATILMRRGGAVDWTTTDPVLNAGEPGFESDTGRFKIGDGVTVWTGLPYFDARAIVLTESGDYTITGIDAIHIVYDGAGGDTFTLPVITAGVVVKIKNAGSGSLTVEPDGVTTIFSTATGQTSLSLGVGDAVELVPLDSGEWGTF